MDDKQKKDCSDDGEYKETGLFIFIGLFTWMLPVHIQVMEKTITSELRVGKNTMGKKNLVETVCCPI